MFNHFESPAFSCLPSRYPQTLGSPNCPYVVVKERKRKGERGKERERERERERAIYTKGSTERGGIWRALGQTTEALWCPTFIGASNSGAEVVGRQRRKQTSRIKIAVRAADH